MLDAGLTVVSLVVIWTLPMDLTGSTRVIATAVVVGTSFVWFVIWLAFGSGIPRRPRWILVGLVLGSVLLGVGLVRVQGYNGDLVPILAWRWSVDPPPAELFVRDPSSSDVPAVVEPSPYDSPGFMGRRRRGEVEHVRLFRNWSARPPRLLWHLNIGDGAGFSSFSVVGQIAVTQQQAGDQELVVCYDLPTGNVVWSHADSVHFTSSIGGAGPRATPSIDEGKVYTMGATGILNCLDATTGERLWRHDVLKENDAVTLRWGIAVSPLIDDDRVVVTTGHPDGPKFGTLVAYDKHSGELIWKAGQDASSYSSPNIVTLDGQQQILIVNNASVSAHDPAEGTILWERPWPKVSSNTAQPVQISPDQLLLTKGYGNGARLWEVARDDAGVWQATELWHERRLLRTKATSPVVRDGCAYGLSDGLLECVELANRKRQWKVRGFGHGQVILVDDLLLVQAESGEVALVEAAPDRFHEVARFAPLSSRTWNYPALAGPYLLVRNDREIACYELPLETESAAQPL